jgi:ankyrin repeat protein
MNLHEIARLNSDEETKNTFLHLNHTNYNKFIEKESAGQTSLHYSAVFNNLTFLELAFGELNDVEYFNIKDNSERTPLHLSVWNAHLRCVIYLIKIGVNINSREKGGYSPIYFATYRKNPEMVGYLLNNNGCPYIKSKETESALTPLNQSCIFGNIEIVKKYLTYDASHIKADKNDQLINISDGNGNTPLISSIRNRHYEVFKVLFMNNLIILDKTDKHDDSILHLIINASLTDYLKFALQSGELSNEIVNMQNRNKLTIYNIAHSNNDSLSTKLLKEYIKMNKMIVIKKDVEYDEKYICNICMDLMYNPCTIACGCHYCLYCITTALKNHPKCPYRCGIQQIRCPELNIQLETEIREEYPTQYDLQEKIFCKQRAISILNSFSEYKHIQLTFNENNTCEFTYDNIRFRVTTLRKELYIYSILLKELPENISHKLSILKLCVEGNLLGSSCCSGGVTILTNNELIIHASIYLHLANSKALIQLMDIFSKTVQKWLIQINKISNNEKYLCITSEVQDPITRAEWIGDIEKVIRMVNYFCSDKNKIEKINTSLVESYWLINNDDILVSIKYNIKDDLLYVYTCVNNKLPTDNLICTTLYEKILKLNLFFTDLPNGGIGIDTKSNDIILHMIIQVGNTSYTLLNDSMPLFINQHNRCVIAINTVFKNTTKIEHIKISEKLLKNISMNFNTIYLNAEFENKQTSHLISLGNDMLKLTKDSSNIKIALIIGINQNNKQCQRDVLYVMGILKKLGFYVICLIKEYATTENVIYILNLISKIVITGKLCNFLFHFSGNGTIVSYKNEIYKTLIMNENDGLPMTFLMGFGYWLIENNISNVELIFDCNFSNTHFLNIVKINSINLISKLFSNMFNWMLDSIDIELDINKYPGFLMITNDINVNYSAFNNLKISELTKIVYSVFFNIYDLCHTQKIDTISQGSVIHDILYLNIDVNSLDESINEDLSKYTQLLDVTHITNENLKQIDIYKLIEPIETQTDTQMIKVPDVNQFTMMHFINMINKKIKIVSKNEQYVKIHYSNQINNSLFFKENKESNDNLILDVPVIYNGEYWTINIGNIHGITEGCIFKVYTTKYIYLCDIMVLMTNTLQSKLITISDHSVCINYNIEYRAVETYAFSNLSTLDNVKLVSPFTNINISCLETNKKNILSEQLLKDIPMIETNEYDSEIQLVITNKLLKHDTSVISIEQKYKCVLNDIHNIHKYKEQAISIINNIIKYRQKLNANIDDLIRDASLGWTGILYLIEKILEMNIMEYNHNFEQDYIQHHTHFDIFTKLFFQVPVLATDGYTYEHSIILVWMENFKTSPYTGKEMTSFKLISNVSKLEEIQLILDDIKISNKKNTNNKLNLNDYENFDEDELDDFNKLITAKLQIIKNDTKLLNVDVLPIIKTEIIIEKCSAILLQREKMLCLSNEEIKNVRYIFNKHVNHISGVYPPFPPELSYEIDTINIYNFINNPYESADNIINKNMNDIKEQLWYDKWFEIVQDVVHVMRFPDDYNKIQWYENEEKSRQLSNEKCLILRACFNSIVNANDKYQHQTKNNEILPGFDFELHSNEYNIEIIQNGYRFIINRIQLYSMSNDLNALWINLYDEMIAYYELPKTVALLKKTINNFANNLLNNIKNNPNGYTYDDMWTKLYNKITSGIINKKVPVFINVYSIKNCNILQKNLWLITGTMDNSECYKHQQNLFTMFIYQIKQFEKNHITIEKVKCNTLFDKMNISVYMIPEIISKELTVPSKIKYTLGNHPLRVKDRLHIKTVFNLNEEHLLKNLLYKLSKYTRMLKNVTLKIGTHWDNLYLHVIHTHKNDIIQTEEVLITNPYVKLTQPVKNGDIIKVIPYVKPLYTSIIPRTFDNEIDTSIDYDNLSCMMYLYAFQSNFEINLLNKKKIDIKPKEIDNLNSDGGYINLKSDYYELEDTFGNTQILEHYKVIFSTMDTYPILLSKNELSKSSNHHENNNENNSWCSFVISYNVSLDK